MKNSILYLFMNTLVVGMTMNIMNSFSIAFLDITPLMVSWLCGQFWMFLPLLAYHFSIMELSLLLYSWILSLKVKLKENMFPYHHLDECKKLQTALELVIMSISKSIFWFFVVILMFSILLAYSMVSFFLSQQDFTLGIVLVMIGYGFYGIFLMFCAHAYCAFSQLIKDHITDIKKLSLEMDIPKESTILIDGKKLNSRHAQKIIVSGFDEFEGFTGNGYFILGKPLLSSIVANLITYLIILIQFKITEVSFSPGTTPEK